MSFEKENPNITFLKKALAERRIDRREFLRSAILVGMAAPAAYAFVGEPLGGSLIRSAAAAMPKGGTLRLGGRIKSLSDPATYSWGEWDSTNLPTLYPTSSSITNVLVMEVRSDPGGSAL
jgi:peptide/nickel transport system substrate-binding protein